MRRTLEALFRHPLQLLILILLLPLIGLGVGYFLPRTYQATATLWALQRYAIIGSTGTESNLQATPAETQATALTELLQTQAFALTVAKKTGLPKTYSTDVQADQQTLDEDLFADMQNIKVASQGYNLFEISYTHKDPAIAKEVVAAVIQNYGFQIKGFSTFTGQRLLETYQTQLEKAKSDASKAAQAEAAYITAHPNLKPADLASDPQYTLLNNETQQAQATVQSIQTRIDTVNQELNDQGGGADSLFKVVDSPTGAKPTSRTRTYLTAGGIGAGVALLAIVLLLIIMVRRDRSLYTPQDVQKVSPYPVLMQVSHFAPATVLELTDHSL